MNSFCRSTVTLLCVSALAALLGFCGGRLWGPGRVAETVAKTGRVETSVLTKKAVVKDFSPEVVGAEDSIQGRVSLEDVCMRLLAEAATPDRDAKLIAAMEKLAERDPLRAIELARQVVNQRLKAQLLGAAFFGWGKTDAGAATAWILSQPKDALNQNEAVAAVLKGAVQNPETAIQLTQQLCLKNPGQAREYGDALIYALAQNGNFQTAADFAVASGEDTRVELLAAAYGSWANYQPQNAANSALQIADAGARQSALDSVIADWGQTDPKGLADFAAGNLPDGDQKTRAMGEALVSWAGEDALSAANWINQFPPSPDFDQGEAAIATQPDVMKQPEVALRWAEAIADPNLRSRTIAAVVETWALSNPGSAMDFVQSSGDVTPEDRAGLLARMGQQ